MAYNTNIGKQSFTAIAAQTEFDFNFTIFKDTDLLVYLTLNGQIPDDDSDKLILATNYTVTITGDTGGKVTLLSGASVGDTIVVQRSLAAIRETEYQTSGDLRAVVLNDDLNYQTYLIADNNLEGNNALRLPDSSVGVDAKLPSVIPEYFLRVNAAGTAFEFTQAVVQVISEVATSVFRLFDGTKKIAFDASNITAGQTRTISMPDNDVDLGALALKSNVLELDNTTPFTPTADYHPTTKKFIEDFGILTVTGTATFTNATNNINLTNIGNIGLEVGDVITVTNSVSNNKEFTVEVITDNDNIIVNEAHAGGSTTKSLVGEVSTAGVTITLLAKWYNASDSLGRGWVNVTSQRTQGVNDTNATGRAFDVGISFGFTSIAVSFVDDISVVVGDGSTNVGIGYTFTVSDGSTYRCQDNINKFMEYR